MGTDSAITNFVCVGVGTGKMASHLCHDFTKSVNVEWKNGAVLIVLQCIILRDTL